MPVEEYAGGTGATTKWDAEQKRMASIIIREGQKMGMSRRDIVIGLMTAMQESSLRNLNHGDRDSLGLFQQRPSMGWGSVQQVRDPVYATRKFFTELGKVGNRNKLSLTQAAQAVQRSGFPDAYAKWEDDARVLLRYSKGKITPVDSRDRPIRDPLTEMSPQRHGLTPNSPLMEGYNPGPANPLGAAGLTKTQQEALGKDTIKAPKIDAGDDEDDQDFTDLVPEVDTSLGEDTEYASPVSASAGPVTGMMQFSTPADYANAAMKQGARVPYGKGVNNTRQGIVDLAQEFIGTPYKWGGTDPSGFDCSGIIQYVYKQMGIDIPRVSYQQANFGKRVGLNKLKPGDLVAWDNSSRNNGADHIAIYLGNGRIIEAAKPGTSVRIRKVRDNEGAWGVQMNI